jgi:hypothetical protein
VGASPQRRSGEGPAGARQDEAPAAQAVRRGPEVRFLLGESGQLRYAGRTARLAGRGANLIGNPWITPHRRTALDRERPLDGLPGASPSTRPRCGALIALR